MDYYIIGYDLNKSGQDYYKLYKTIKSAGDWWHSLGSTWIVKSDKTADEIHSMIAEVIDDNDELLVALLCDEVAWSGFVDKGGKWLEDNFHDCKKHGSKRKKKKASKDKNKCGDKDKSNAGKGKGLQEGHGVGNDKDKSKCEDKDKSNSGKGKGLQEGHGVGNDKNKSKGGDKNKSNAGKGKGEGHGIRNNKNKPSKSNKSNKKKK